MKYKNLIVLNRITSGDFPDARFKRLKEHFTDPMIKVYTTFYQATLPVFTAFNMILQSEAPQIHYLPSEQLMSRLASKFIKTCVIQNLKTRGESFSSLDISVSNQLDDDLSVGILTKLLINHLLDDGSISDSQVDKFYDSVRAFYERAYEYCIQWLPLDDDFLKYCGFVDFFRRIEVP